MEPRIQYAQTTDEVGIAPGEGREVELRGLSGRQWVYEVVWETSR